MPILQWFPKAQMYGSHYRKPLKDANFLSVKFYVYVCHMFTKKDQKLTTRQLYTDN